MKTILGPKFIKRANMWCVTILVKGKDIKQEITWFETEEEATEFYQKNKL